MSGSHAKVEVLGDSVYVTDLKSTNGTFVQDEKIKPETKTEVSLVLRPLAPPNAAGPPKADAVPSHSHLPGQGRAERHLRGLQPRKLHGPAGGRRVRWGRPSSWRGRGHGLASSLRAPRRGTIFFFTFNQDSSVPNLDRSPRHPPRSPAGRGRPLSTSQCFAGRYFSRGGSGRRIRGK